jgi:hypothetical protein
LGILGNAAPDAADLNLIAQLSVLFLLLVGGLLAKLSLFKVHGRFMISLIAFQFFAVFVWMLPSLLRNLGALGSGGAGTGITLLHFFAGSITLAFVIAAAAHFRDIQLKWTMRIAISAWFLVATAGIAFYAHYYLGII